MVKLNSIWLEDDNDYGNCKHSGYKNGVMIIVMIA